MTTRTPRTPTAATPKKRAPQTPSPLSVKVAEQMAKEGYVRAIDAARRVGVVPSTIYNWIREERVVAKHVGKATFVRVDSLLSQLGAEQCRVLKVTTDPVTWAA